MLPRPYVTKKQRKNIMDSTCQVGQEIRTVDLHDHWIHLPLAISQPLMWSQAEPLDHLWVFVSIIDESHQLTQAAHNSLSHIIVLVIHQHLLQHGQHQGTQHLWLWTQQHNNCGLTVTNTKTSLIQRPPEIYLANQAEEKWNIHHDQE